MRKLILMGVSIMLFGCGSVDVKKYEGTEPKISFRKLYDSNVEGYGYFRDRSGEIGARYYVTLEPKWDGNTGTMKEFNYQEDGKVTSRDWKVEMTDDDHFTATGSDIEGIMTGVSSGYALHLDYIFNIQRESGSKIALHFDDWSYLQPDGTVLNEVVLSKFGFKVGTLTYHLRKLKSGEKFKKGYFPEKR